MATSPRPHRAQLSPGEPAMENRETIETRLARIGEMSLGMRKDELRRMGYDLCYLNLLAAFGVSHTPDEIEQLTLACMRNYCSSASQFAAFTRSGVNTAGAEETLRTVASSVDLKPGVLDTISELQRISGAFVATYHWGGFRLVSMRLASLGKYVTVLMDRLTHDPGSTPWDLSRKTDNMSSQWDPLLHQYFGQRLQFVVAEDKTALVRIYRAIETKNLVMMYPDGNSGWDGPKGKQARVSVSFLGQTIKVKTGIIRMALLMQAPVVILTAERLANGRVLVDVEDVLHPPPANSSAAATFINDALQRIYSGLEKCVRLRPEQWESARHFHRWREPADAPKPDPSPALKHDIEEGLAMGWRYFTDHRRVARVVLSGREVLVDARTMCAYEAEPAMLKLLSECASSDVFATEWKQFEREPARREAFVKLLALLSVRGLLQTNKQLREPAPGMVEAALSMLS